MSSATQSKDAETPIKLPVESTEPEKAKENEVSSTNTKEPENSIDETPDAKEKTKENTSIADKPKTDRNSIDSNKSSNDSASSRNPSSESVSSINESNRKNSTSSNESSNEEKSNEKLSTLDSSNNNNDTSKLRDFRRSTKKSASPTQMLICAWCDKRKPLLKYILPTLSGENLEFCSEMCLAQFRKAVKKGACKQCGNAIRPAVAPNREYCSAFCFNKSQPKNGKYWINMDWCHK